MRLYRGTLLIAAFAAAVAVVLALKGGQVAGVVVAVTAGLVSAALWQVREDRIADHARAAELEKAEQVYALPGPALDGGAVQFLRPEEEVVSFWPRPELDELLSWMVTGGYAKVQLVTGGGGTGKTRLARQLAGDVAGLGVRSLWVAAGAEPGAARTARDAATPVLLIVDYAETRTGLRELLAEVMSDTDGPDMSVLLLARSPGEWWQQLISNSGFQLRELLAAVQPITLGPVSASSRQSEVVPTGSGGICQ